MENFIEELIAEYYKTKGYFVTINYWIHFNTERKRVHKGKSQTYKARSWSDIDVLARNDTELLLIQVKATINQINVANKIIEQFKRVQGYLDKGKANDGISDISWWSKDCSVKKIVIYEDPKSPKTYMEKIINNQIECKCFTEVFADILTYINNREGVKEGNATMRLLHFLKQNKLLK